MECKHWEKEIIFNHTALKNIPMTMNKCLHEPHNKPAFGHDPLDSKFTMTFPKNLNTISHLLTKALTTKLTMISYRTLDQNHDNKRSMSFDSLQDNKL